VDENPIHLAIALIYASTGMDRRVLVVGTRGIAPLFRVQCTPAEFNLSHYPSYQPTCPQALRLIRFPKPAATARGRRTLPSFAPCGEDVATGACCSFCPRVCGEIAPTRTRAERVRVVKNVLRVGRWGASLHGHALEPCNPGSIRVGYFAYAQLGGAWTRLVSTISTRLHLNAAPPKRFRFQFSTPDFFFQKLIEIA
jgi:hypothetical protein